MPQSKSDVLKYLADTNARFGAYHNHKEAMAWAAVVLYYVFVVKLVDVAYSQHLASRGQRLTVTLILIVISLAALLVLREQHRLRQIAAEVYAACQRLASRCLSMNDDEIGSLDLSLAEPTSQYPGPAYLIKCLVLESVALRGAGRGARRRLERLSYWLVAIAMLVALGAIWLREA
jgi:hypothetical protein